jgi:hypothetical protein
VDQDEGRCHAPFLSAPLGTRTVPDGDEVVNNFADDLANTV